MVESISYLNLRERLLLRSEGFAGLPSTEKLCLVCQKEDDKEDISPEDLY
ncbi:hypothetical protein HKBW3S47_02218, partial [Candidatus Hakubella thermalkaliphila]